MKKIVSLELKKALRNKMFLIAVLIGCGISVISLIYNVSVYQQGISIGVQAGIETNNPYLPAYILFNRWMGGEPFSLGTSVFFFVFPILAAIPYGWSYCEEKNNGYIYNIIVRSGKKEYLTGKIIAVFITGGLTMVIPLLFNFFISAMIFPAITPMVTYSTSYAVFGKSFLAELYYTHPFLYILIYLCIDFLFVGVLTCISIAACHFVRRKGVCVISPFFLCMIIHFSRQFLYVSSTSRYQEVSPFYFLRPAETAYSASGSIILLIIVILLGIVIINLVGEKKNEIY